MTSNSSSDPKHILIIKLRHHGDVLLATPLITKLKQAYPNSCIDALVYTETKDMLRYNNELKNIYCIDRSWKKLGVRKQLGLEFSLLKSLRDNHYDLIIHLTESWRGALISRLCSPLNSIGYDYPQRRSWLWVHSFVHLVPWQREEVHTVEFHLRALLPLKIQSNSDISLKLGVAEKDIASTRSKLTKLGWQGQAYVLIHPAARWFFKCWDDEKIAQLIQNLLDNQFSVVLTAGPSDAEKNMVSNIRNKVGQANNLFDLSGQLTLTELAAAISGAMFFIGVDSAPTHMASALNIPGLALFGATKINVWHPWKGNITLIDARDFAEVPDPDQVDTNTDERYLTAIPLVYVWDLVFRELSKLRVSPSLDV